MAPAHLGWGSWGLGPCLLSLYSPRPRLKTPPGPPTPTFALNEMWGKGPGWGPEVGSPSPPSPLPEGLSSPQFPSSDAGNAKLPFPVVRLSGRP